MHATGQEVQIMTGQAIAFTESHQILAWNVNICRQNFNSAVRSQKLQPRTKRRTSDGAQDRLSHRIYHIHHNHQISRNIRLISENRAVRFLVLVFAPHSYEISKKSRRYQSPQLLSSAYSEGLRFGGVVATAQVNDWATVNVISRPRLVQGLHLLLPIQGARKPAPLFARPAGKSHDRKTALGMAGTIGFEPKPTMICRIDRLVIGEDRVILRISGRISGQDVDMFRALLEQERSVVSIDLKGVLLVDREAVKLLAICESNGAELRNCPAYIREWVTRESADTNVSEQS